MVVHEIYEQSSKFSQTQEGQIDSGSLSLDILSHSTLHYKQNYDAPLSNMNRKEIEAPIFARTTSSEIICSASVPLSPIYNHVKINDSEATNLYYSSGFISTENKEVHATHCEAPQLLSETSNTQLSEENRLSLKDEARFENSVQSISENFITSPSKDFVPDTYAVAEASPLQQGSQLSQQLTLSQDRNSLPYSKPSVILVPDTFHDDQMTLDIDISDNELEESDSSSCVSEEIHHISKVDNVGVSTGLHATDFRDQETATLVPRTQAVFSIESDDNPRIVLDTLDDFPSHTHPEARTNDSNLYELSSSEDDHENYLQFSSKRKKRDLQEIPPIPEHDVVNLVNDTLSSVPLSGLDGTLVSGTIQKSATLISSIENLPSELIENELEVDNIPPKLQNTLEPEDNIPEVSFSLNRKSPPLSASVGKSDDQQIKSMPSIRRELDEGNEYNVESYCTQFDNERPEIGGYLYGAAIDSAVRRFTPQKPSPENKVQDQRSPEIAKNDTFHLNSKLPRTHDFNSESYETQDSLPSRFTWSKVVSTPLKQKNYARDATCEKPSPNEAQRPPPHPEESNTNDDIASWGESVSYSFIFD